MERCEHQILLIATSFQGERNDLPELMDIDVHKSEKEADIGIFVKLGQEKNGRQSEEEERSRLILERAEAANREIQVSETADRTDRWEGET